jgi:hypothetical protein
LGITKRMKKNGIKRSDLEKVINCVWKISQKKCKDFACAKSRGYVPAGFLRRQKTYLFFDESQETEKTISEVRTKNMFSNKIATMYHVTATPRKNLEYGRVFFVFDCLSTKGFDLSTYKGLEDCSFFPRGISKIPRNASDFISEIGMNEVVEKDPRFYKGIYYTLKEHDILKTGNYVFIPGKTSTASHDIIVDMCLAINPKTVVVIVNHNHKAIQYVDEDGDIASEPLNDKLILDDAIAEAVKENNFAGRPLVVTGLNCVLASQTLTNSILGPFTHAIFGYGIIQFKHQKDGGIFGQDRAYQLGGRTTGKRGDRIIKCRKCFSENLSIVSGGVLECLDCETKMNYPSGLIYTNKKTHKIMIRMRNKDIQTVVFCDRRFKRVALDAEVKTNEMVKKFGGKTVKMEDYDNLGERNPLSKDVKIHVERVVIGNKKDWVEFKINSKYEINESLCSTKEEALEYLSNHTETLGKKRNLRMKGTIKGYNDIDFYIMNREHKEIADIEHVYEFCKKYNTTRTENRGNFYACYRNKKDPSTLEFWFTYGVHY